VTDPAEDYRELLEARSIRRWIEDPSERSEWRAQIRARARSDRLRVRTYLAPTEPRLTIAVLARRRPSFRQLRAEVEALSLQVGDVVFPASWLEG
jgi:hypothetical protein